MEEEIKKSFHEAMDPDKSKYECFFHYTDKLIFRAGFLEGVDYMIKYINGKLGEGEE